MTGSGAASLLHLPAPSATPQIANRFLTYRFWHLLADKGIRRAIDECLKLKPRPHPGEAPYIMTRGFLEKMSPKPTSALERVLSRMTE
jgi:hypothetical protein